MFRLIILFQLCLISIFAFAKEGKSITQSQMSIELNPVPGATAYEVELFQVSNKKKYKFKLKNNLWTAILPVGKYKFRLRAYDHRSVPGAWGAFKEVDVILPNPKVISETPSVPIENSEGDFDSEIQKSKVLMDSINKVNSWYGIGSLLFSSLDYQSVSSEANTQTHFSRVSFSGRIGIGFAPPENRYGGFAVLDLNGIQSPYGFLTYPSLELHGLFTKRFLVSQLRATWGVFSKLRPDFITGSSGAVLNENLSFIGLHGGIEYWHSLNKKYGVKFNLHYYESLIGTHTSNGQELQPSLYSQFGLFGSYRIQNNIMLFAGYSQKNETIRYQSKVGGTSLAKSGDVNSVSLLTQNINFISEYEF